MTEISKARLTDAYNEGWNNSIKCRASHFYGFGHLPELIEREYSRGYTDATNQRKGLSDAH